MPKPVKYTARDGTTTWRVRFRHAGRATSETFPTKVAADLFCRDYKERGATFAVKMRDEDTHTTPTVAELTDDYLTWKARRVRSDRTIADYRREYRKWIAPTFGNDQAGRVSQADVQAWVEDMLEKGCAPKSIGERHALLHAVYKWAAERLSDHDPCKATDLPRKRKTPPKGLRPAEWEALHSNLRQGCPDAADLAQFLLASGWRWSEAIALTTYDVEDDGQRVWVTMTQVLRRNAAGQELAVQDGKAEASMRRLELDSGARGMIRARVARTRSGGLVFTTPAGGQWRYSNFRIRHWEPAVTTANLARRPTVHWLRHTHVGWMLLTGKATLPELQARIGHASITTTIGVYGRMITDVQPEALDAFARMASGEQPRQIGD